MMKALVWMRLFAGVGLALLAAGAAQAASEAEREILDRMEARLSEVMELKLSGKVGENNRALLEPLKTLERDARRLVAEQNRDRMAIYRMISERIGVPVDNVQATRAKDIRGKSPKGVWLQSPKGDWYRE